jgi:hypothetical protein
LKIFVRPESEKYPQMAAPLMSTVVGKRGFVMVLANRWFYFENITEPHRVFI